MLFNEIANSISYERWEGTLEYTFMAPVSRLVHLFGMSLYAVFYSIARLVVIVVGLALFIKLKLAHANLAGVLVVLMVSSLAFIGVGLIAAVQPVLSLERGAEATNIFQGCLLPACRKLIGIGATTDGRGELMGAPISAVVPELLTLAAMGVVMIPFGLWVFGYVERWAKKTGKLKRTG